MKRQAPETDILEIASFMEVSRKYFALPLESKTGKPLAVNPAQSSSHQTSLQPIRYRKIMNKYRKLIPSLLLATGLGSLFAGQVFADVGCGTMGREHQHGQHAKHMEQHHNMLHDALKLTAEQEPGWKKLMDSEQPKASAGITQSEDWLRISRNVTGDFAAS